MDFEESFHWAALKQGSHCSETTYLPGARLSTLTLGSHMLSWFCQWKNLGSVNDALTSWIAAIVYLRLVLRQSFMKHITQLPQLASRLWGGLEGRVAISLSPPCRYTRTFCSRSVIPSLSISIHARFHFVLFFVWSKRHARTHADTKEELWPQSASFMHDQPVGGSCYYCWLIILAHCYAKMRGTGRRVRKDWPFRALVLHLTEESRERIVCFSSFCRFCCVTDARTVGLT